MEAVTGDDAPAPSTASAAMVPTAIRFMKHLPGIEVVVEGSTSHTV
jgi:hypothetical protein